MIVRPRARSVAGSRQREQREDQRYNPEAGDDFGLAPAEQLKMVMQRGHLEDAFAVAQLVAADL